MVSNSKKSSLIKVNLIDYEMATSFMDGNKHIEEHQQVDTFRGNILFASLNQLNFNKTTRIDDLISLFYLIVYLLNEFEMPNSSSLLDQDNLSEAFKKCKKYK
jgi:hypothetical protein